MKNKIIVTDINATAFASTFHFLQHTIQPHQKIKRACKPTHQVTELWTDMR
jgi:hypothetical protein